MSTYLESIDILGADVPLTQAEKAQAIATVKVTTIVGAVVGGVLGALIWGRHRIGGAAIGGLLVGPFLGAGLGMHAASNDLMASRRARGVIR